MLRKILILALACLGWNSTSGAAPYQIGPTRSLQSVSALPQLHPGDVVEIDSGTYKEVMRWTSSGTAAQPIVIRGVGAPVFDADGLRVDGVLPRPRAVFQIEGDFVTVENIEFRNARNGDNGAGIRITSANNVTVRGCRITQCDMGIMCDHNRNLIIEACEIAFNGTPLYNGYSHNLYLGGQNTTVRFCSIHDALYGQNFKSRGHYTELLYNSIADSQDGEVGLVDAAETRPANSHAVMIGNVIVSKPRQNGYNSGRFIQFGQDSGGDHNGILFAFNNTFVAGDGRIQFLSANATNAKIVADNNVFYGSDKILGVGAGVRGSNNWMQASALVPDSFAATVQGGSPGFVNSTQRDFHLTSASACRDHGLNTLVFLDGEGLSHPGAPTEEYVPPMRRRTRQNDGRLDIGAFEYFPADH